MYSLTCLWKVPKGKPQYPEWRPSLLDTTLSTLNPKCKLYLKAWQCRNLAEGQASWDSVFGPCVSASSFGFGFRVWGFRCRESFGFRHRFQLLECKGQHDHYHAFPCGTLGTRLSCLPRRLQTMLIEKNLADLSILWYHNSQGVRYLGSCRFFSNHRNSSQDLDSLAITSASSV